MGNKDLVLFTEAYPYGSHTEGSFVVPELTVLQARFRKVIIVASRKLDDETSNTVPEGVIVDSSYLESGCRGLTRGHVIGHLLNWVSVIKYRDSTFVRSVGFTRFKRWFAKFKSKHSIDDKNAVYYSFWLDREAEWLGMYAKEHPDSIAVSRAHRYDIFDIKPYSFRCRALTGLSWIYPCSDDGANKLRELYPNSAVKIKTSYLGVQKLFQAENPADKANEIRFISVHMLNPRKRCSLSIALLSLLAERHRDASLKYVIVGDGPELYSLEAMSRTVPKNLSVEFRGGLSNFNVQKLLCEEHFDCALLLSDSEGLPVFVMEALAYGIPTVACDVGGVSECVTVGNGVLLNKEFDLVEAAEKIWTLIKDKDARECAVSTYKEKFRAEVLREQFAVEVSSLDSKGLVV